MPSMTSESRKSVLITKLICKYVLLFVKTTFLHFVDQRNSFNCKRKGVQHTVICLFKVWDSTVDLYSIFKKCEPKGKTNNHYFLKMLLFSNSPLFQHLQKL